MRAHSIREFAVFEILREFLEFCLEFHLRKLVEARHEAGDGDAVVFFPLLKGAHAADTLLIETGLWEVGESRGGHVGVNGAEGFVQGDEGLFDGFEAARGFEGALFEGIELLVGDGDRGHKAFELLLEGLFVGGLNLETLRLVFNVEDVVVQTLLCISMDISVEEE